MTLSLSPFQVQCPSCQTEFPVDPDRVPPGGVHAICSVCQRTFHVEVPEDSSYDSPAAPPAATSPDRTDDEATPETYGFDDPTEGTQATEAGPEGDAPTTDRIFAPPAPTSPSEPESFDPREAGEATVEEAPETEDEAPPPVQETTTPADEALEDLSGLTAEALAEVDEETPDRPAALSLGAARFSRRDPHERARRLARVLVSDIIAYYPEKHAEAVRRGTVKEEFEQEVEKSRKEYVDQVGAEIADSTPYFREALNEVLARGRQVF